MSSRRSRVVPHNCWTTAMTIFVQQIEAKKGLHCVMFVRTPQGCSRFCEQFSANGHMVRGFRQR